MKTYYTTVTATTVNITKVDVNKGNVANDKYSRVPFFNCKCDAILEVLYGTVQYCIMVYLLTVSNTSISILYTAHDCDINIL